MIDMKRVQQIARARVAEAVREGVLVRPNQCSSCNRLGVTHGHHDDYQKPLDVRWLCASCHSEQHGAVSRRRNYNPVQELAKEALRLEKAARWIEEGRIEKGVVEYAGSFDFDADRIRRIRMRLGLSQPQFAKEFGFAESAVSAWESGGRKPTSAKSISGLVQAEVTSKVRPALIKAARDAGA